jgi:hypothetical protein
VKVEIQRRDRPWVDAYVTVLCGPFAMPSVDELRQAVRRLASSHPQSRLTWRLDETKRHWLSDRDAVSVVTERDWDDGSDSGAILDAMERDESLDPPLVLIRYPNYIGLKMSHGVGDGRMFLTVISAVLTTAMTGEVAPWPAEPGGRFPLIKASANTFGRRPQLIKSAADDRFLLPADEAVANRRIESWSPSRRTVHVPLPRKQADEFFAWAKEHAPRASRFALQIALILRALPQVGIVASPDVRVIVDLRRYLGWKYIDGNFVAGVPMQIGPDMSAELISSTMRATMASGRPLLNQILATVRGGTATSRATSVDLDERPRLSFTNMGSSPEINGLPFLTNLPPVYAGSVPPDGPHGVTFLVAEAPAFLTMNATFHDNVVDPALVRGALELAASDPIGLLSGTEGLG